MTRFDTEAVHAGDAFESWSPVEPALVLSTAFAFPDAASAAGRFEAGLDDIYTRWSNPTVRGFEKKLAALEGAPDAVALASGMGAIFGVLSANLEVGKKVLAPKCMYAETTRLLRGHFARFGVQHELVDFRDLEAVGARVEEAALIWCETPANPLVDVYDIRGLAQIAKGSGALLVVDSTFATPYHQCPLELGADLVVHSTTKAIGGHGDAIGGVVCGPLALVERVRQDAVRGSGNVLSPMNAFLLSRGLKTLGLRMERSSASALTLAQRLSGHTKVSHVHYPGLVTHPQHELAKSQMHRGFGSMVAFEVEGGVQEAARIYDRLNTITRAVSLGDTRTLITCPAATTHYSLSAEQRAEANITDGLFRLSVGIEHVEDLWQDLDQALSPL